MIDLDQHRVKPGNRPDLSEIPARQDAGLDSKADGEALLASNVERIDELQGRLWAEGRRSILLVLQGMDTSGKDGTIRKVFTGVNPAAFEIHQFGVPGPHEIAQDYLWRAHARTPRRGRIGIFNRSHYEDVLVARVAKLVEKSVWKRRYDHINDFERMLHDEGTSVVKCFLHISREEQFERLNARIDDPRKNWKLSPSDFTARADWPEYREAYEDVLARCSTKQAPWYVVPADRKWVRNAIVSQLIRDTLEKLDPKYPEGVEDLEALRTFARDHRDANG